MDRENEFLTPQELADTLKISTYTAYELIKRGEIPAFRVGRQLRVSRREFDRYVESVRPAATESTGEVGRDAAPSSRRVRIAGSHDPALELLISQVRKTAPELAVSVTYMGSLLGLMELFRRQVDIAASHLWEGSDKSRVEYLAHVLPGHRLTVIRLCSRTVGLAAAAGNPKRITGIRDLVREDVTFVNRQKGSGTRVRLDRLLKKEALEPSSIHGYEDELETHHAVALAVGSGQADVGIVCETAARGAGLHFVPLYREPYDLVMLTETLELPSIGALVATLHSKEFRERLEELPGYDLSELGDRKEVET